MKRSKEISIIVSVFNNEKYVGACLRSLLKQNFNVENYEIIVINDASEDNTKDALKPYFGDIRYFENEKRLGLPASLNIGIRNARGQYIVRVDSDDYVHWEYLKILYLHMQLNHDMDAAACDYLLVDNQQNTLARKNCIEEPIGCGIMFRIDQLIDIGLYDEKFLAREDEDLRIRFLKKYTISRVQLPLYRYRKHVENLTNDKENMDKYSNILKKKYRDQDAGKIE